MRKLIDLSKLFHKLPVGIVKSDSEGNLSAAQPDDFPIPINMMPKPNSATVGNLAAFDENKEVVDSGKNSSDFATADHNHDSAYATLEHNHDEDYSAITHNHDEDYSASTHNHDEDYAAITHNHDGDYSAATHDHDDTYAAKATAVVGPESAIDGEIAVFDGLTGKLLKNSSALLSVLNANSLTNQKTGSSIKIWVGTEAEFLLIPEPDTNTLYFRSM